VAGCLPISNQTNLQRLFIKRAELRDAIRGELESNHNYSKMNKNSLLLGISTVLERPGIFSGENRISGLINL